MPRGSQAGGGAARPASLSFLAAPHLRQHFQSQSISAMIESILKITDHETHACSRRNDSDGGA
jgi:hypothetical protein